MNFAQQIKKLRAEKNLTQEQMAERLGVTRQAVSHWENDRNLPDIEVLILMSKAFGISLDELILGEKDMNNMAKKLISDGSEGRRAKRNLIGIIIGAALLLLGFGCLMIKGMSVEYVDADGFLHENFFLLPVGFAFLFGGIISFAATGAAALARRFRKK